MPVTIKADLDVSAAKRTHENFQREIQKSPATQKHAPVSSRFSASAKEAATGTREAIKKGEGLSEKIGGDLDEFASGGFYNSFRQNFSGMRETLSLLKRNNNGKNSNEDSSGSITGSGSSLIRKVARLQTERGETRTLTVARMDVRQMRRIGAGGSAVAGGAAGAGNSGTGNMIGNAASSTGKSIPVYGAILTIAGAVISGAMKLISSIGQRHASAVMSQAQTYGATGGYVGGGGGYFMNADIARAQLTYSKATGKNIFQKGNLFGRNNPDAIRFASSQNMDVSELAGSLGELQRGNSRLSLLQLRAAAKQNRVFEKMQGEFVSKLAEIKKGNRESGFGEMNVRDFLKLTTGISQGTSSFERSTHIAGELDKRMRGADRGGIMGQLALMHELKRNGGDYFKAVQTLEKGGATGQRTKEAMQTIGDPRVAAMLMRNEGISSYTEALKANFAGKEINTSDVYKIHAEPNKVLQTRNKIEETFANSEAAGKAYQIGQTAVDNMLKLFQDNQSALIKIADSIHGLETAAFKGIGTTITESAKIMEEAFHGEMTTIKGYLAEMTESLNPF